MHKKELFKEAVKDAESTTEFILAFVALVSMLAIEGVAKFFFELLRHGISILVLWAFGMALWGFSIAFKFLMPIILFVIKILAEVLDLSDEAIDKLIDAINIVGSGIGSAVGSVTSAIGLGGGGGFSVDIPKLPPINVEDILPGYNSYSHLDETCSAMSKWYNMVFFILRVFLSDSVCPIPRYFWKTWFFWFIMLITLAFSWNPDPTDPEYNCSEPDAAWLCFVLGIGRFIVTFVVPVIILSIAVSSFWPLIDLLLKFFYALLLIAWDMIHYPFNKPKYAKLIPIRVFYLKKLIE